MSKCTVSIHDFAVSSLPTVTAAIQFCESHGLEVELKKAWVKVSGPTGLRFYIHRDPKDRLRTIHLSGWGGADWTGRGQAFLETRAPLRPNGKVQAESRPGLSSVSALILLAKCVKTLCNSSRSASPRKAPVKAVEASSQVVVDVSSQDAEEVSEPKRNGRKAKAASSAAPRENAHFACEQ